jgi:hypothetical protein
VDAGFVDRAGELLDVAGLVGILVASAKAVLTAAADPVSSAGIAIAVEIEGDGTAYVAELP